ncbi:acyl-CoA desaturase [Candidatus Litorirhabdus singularis]|uniref:acyl-CoA desaturase n=1 Tax=Candidatus Litorirhabdus singularis TaxID=2518993 RepID=UPI00242E6F9C|nr:acyl-CoA desaturase [Candidatus Litorirhabdus singularis]
MDWYVFALIWPLQLLGSTLALHRYFAHRSFATSRVFQGFLALCAATAFGDPIGFSGKHRLHHRHTDTDADVHSPTQGAWSCWIGSLVDFGYREEEVLRNTKDLCRYPELVWLHKHKYVPACIIALALFAYGGFTTVAIGLCLGAVSIIHLAGAVNYFCHTRGSRRFNTSDDSTNNAIIAVLALGEGWHNNHHYYPSSARAGLYWWEIDAVYWVICLLERTGLIWAVRRPPARVYQAVSLKG